jgi:hypothetical protein
MLGRKAVARAAWTAFTSLSFSAPVEVVARACPAAALLSTSGGPAQLWSAQWRQASTSSETPFAATQALLEVGR